MRQPHKMPPATSHLFLGLDGGGTQTRWAVCDAMGSVLASGALAALNTLRLGDAAVLQQTRVELQGLAQALHALPGADAVGVLGGVFAGMSGIGAPGETAATQLAHALAQALALDVAQVHVTSDIALACTAAFAPGQGYLIYAGTGSVAAFVDAQGQLHRAGGRGGILDDGGSGYWIAREALRHIWRQEDERPGAWESSPMAVRVFAAIGGSDWSHTRALVYAGSRGAVGELALAVAAAASDDLVARQILHRAGQELARLGQAMEKRFGPRPMALGGRVSTLHPVILTSLRDSLGTAQELQVVQSLAHVEAARLAARKDTSR